MSALQLSIGFSGLALSLVYRLPQLWKMYSTMSVKDISLWMVYIQNLSYIFYIIYGVMISDIVYIVSSIVSLVQNFMIITLYIWYANNNANNKNPPSTTGNV
jgi:uncharacterized protein with PQ loop repeat